MLHDSDRSFPLMPSSLFLHRCSSECASCVTSLARLFPTVYEPGRLLAVRGLLEHLRLHVDHSSKHDEMLEVSCVEQNTRMIAMHTHMIS